MTTLEDLRKLSSRPLVRPVYVVEDGDGELDSSTFTFYVRGLTGIEADNLSILAEKIGDTSEEIGRVRRNLVVSCIVESKDNPVPAVPEKDVEGVGNDLPAVAIRNGWDVIRKLSGITTEGEEEIEGE